MEACKCREGNWASLRCPLHGLPKQAVWVNAQAEQQKQQRTEQTAKG